MMTSEQVFDAAELIDQLATLELAMHGTTPIASEVERLGARVEELHMALLALGVQPPPKGTVDRLDASYGNGATVMPQERVEAYRKVIARMLAARGRRSAYHDAYYDVMRARDPSLTR